MTPVDARLVGAASVEDRWDEIAALLRAAFGDSAISEELSAEGAAQQAWERIHEPGGRGLGHIVAEDRDGRLLGTFLCIPTERGRNETCCDVGWFCADPTLPDSERERVGDALVFKTHEELAELGFEAAVTAVGSEAAADFLSRRHGYMPAPLGDRKDRWITCLRAAPDDSAVISSAKRRWESAGGQLARYATTDIAKDEVIVDLKAVMKRVGRPSANTLQLAEGYHYQAFPEPLRINHHCSPNGYMCFEDMTYRALRDVSAGEELTFHYCTTEFEMANPFDCLCGSPDCLGWVAGFKHLDEKQVEKLSSLLLPYLKSKL